MENQVPTEQIIKQVINTWTAQNKIVTNFFNKHEDSAYAKEVAPNRNRATYLLGHLTAVSDTMIPLMGLGSKMYPELEATFIKSPDKAVADSEMPTVAELKQKWEAVNTTLTNHFSAMTVSDWLGRHTSVSEEDFKLDPLRNKLNILLSRTNHQSYHIGQLNFLTV